MERQYTVKFVDLQGVTIGETLILIIKERICIQLDKSVRRKS